MSSLFWAAQCTVKIFSYCGSEGERILRFNQSQSVERRRNNNNKFMMEVGKRALDVWPRSGFFLLLPGLNFRGPDTGRTGHCRLTHKGEGGRGWGMESPSKYTAIFLPPIGCHSYSLRKESCGNVSSERAQFPLHGLRQE